MARSTKNVTLTIVPALHDWAVAYAKANNILGGFSAYVTKLITEDMAEQTAATPRKKRTLPRLDHGSNHGTG